VTDTAALPTGALPAGTDQHSPVFVISVAAQLAGLHAQTLRGYDRLGLVCPVRASGRHRKLGLSTRTSGQRLNNTNKIYPENAGQPGPRTGVRASGARRR
jgi:hypothetical protein